MELIHNTKYKIEFGENFDFLKIHNFTKNPKCRKYSGILGVFVKEIVIFYIGFGFVVFNSIW